MTIPKTLGGCADQLFKLKLRKGIIQQQIDAIEEEEKAIQEHLIRELPNNGSTGVVGLLAKVNVLRKVVPQVKDWDQLYKHILKTKDFSLLQRRVGETSWKEQTENGKPIPGVEAFTAMKISLTKV